MNRYIKISAALAAFALLLVVMGLSTSSSVDAQTTRTDPAISGAGGTIHICTDRDCNIFTPVLQITPPAPTTTCFRLASTLLAQQ